MKIARLIASGLLVLSAAGLPGCGGNVEKLGGHVQRGKERQTNQNDLQQIALFYIQFDSENDRPPASLEEFKTYVYKDSPKLFQKIEDGSYVINFKVKPSSNTVVAYEKEPDLNGNHLVVWGDKATKLVSSSDLQKALQNKGE